MAANIHEQATQAVQTFEIVKQEEIAAPIGIVFETILEQMGPLNSTPGEADANEVGGVAGRTLVSRSGKQHGALLGRGAGDQASVAAGDMRAAVHVHAGSLKSPVPADRRERIDAAPVCASSDGVDRRIGPRSGCRLDRPDDPDSQGGIKAWQQALNEQH